MGIDAIKFVGSTKKFEEKIESKLHHLCKFMILESKKKRNAKRQFVFAAPKY